MNDLAINLNEIRDRLLRGETVPDDVLREALRAARLRNEAAAQETKGKKQPARSAEDLLALLDTEIKT